MVPRHRAATVTALLFAGLTLRELARRRLVAAVAVLTLAIVVLTAVGMTRLAGVVIDGAPLPPPAVRGTASGIVLLLAFFFSFVVALGAALIGAPALAESIANGEILALLARPIRRADVVLGRWLGTLCALTVYVAIAGGIELAVVASATGYVPPHPFAALLYLAGVGAVVTTAAIALAVRLPALAAGAVAALCFGVAWIGGIVEAIGLALGSRTIADAGTIVTLLFPSDALWRGACYALQPALITAAAATNQNPGGNPFAVTAPPPPALLAWSGGWVVVVLGAAIVAMRRRDL
jgi:ABC-type transport system involved in multi-copper enzyme maturation permease subunit